MTTRILTPRCILLGLILCLILGLAAPVSQAQPTDATARVEALFAPWDRPGTPGMVVTVVHDGEVVHNKGYGQAQLGFDAPLTPASVFDIASLAKQFAAFGVALLAVEGRIDLDADVRTYVPEVPDFGTPITVRHLVHHTAGLRDWPGTLAVAGWHLDDVIAFDQILRMLFHQQALNFAPGARYSYSNTGYNLLAEIISRVTETPFAAWMEAQLFQPLGMHDTHFQTDHARVVPQRVQGYVLGRGGFRQVPSSLTAVGSSSLFTTADDLVRWVRNFEEMTVGSPEVMALVHTRGELNDGTVIPYAFGHNVAPYRGLTSVRHSGSWAGFRTHLLRFPEDGLAVVILSNHGAFNPAPRVDEIAEIYLGDRMAAAEQAGTSSGKPAVSVPTERLDAFAGTYRLGPGWMVTITRKGDQLETQATGERVFPMTATSDTTFWIDGYRAGMTFRVPADGPATMLVYKGIHAPRMTPIGTDPAPHGDYVGTYHSTELDATYAVAEQDGGLMIAHMRHGPTPLSRAYPDLFTTSRWFMPEVRFERDAAGRVTALLLSNSRSLDLRFERQAE